MDNRTNGGPPIRRTKIVATLGPATGNQTTIGALLQAGANVLRINASHGTAELRAEWIAAARRVAKQMDLPIAILLDLQGPRIRVGDLPAPRELTAGQQVVFAPEDVARGDELPTTYEGLATDARIGSRILLNDGLLSVEVTGVDAPRVRGRVIDGGILTAHKGMNLPGVQVSAPALTEKDREDVQDALKIGVDYLALSFVRRPEDIEELRALAPGTTKLVAKIEKATALDNLEKIVAVSDAVMVARGDLGVELPFEQVPLVQKRLIAEANHQGKPVITATQERRMARDGVHTEDAIAWGTHAVARMLKTPLIVTLTKGGFTARKVAALRPPVPILAVTTELPTYRQLALVWGIIPVLVDRVPGYDAMLTVVRDLILKRQYAKSGDSIVMTAGVPWDVSGSTNLIKVEQV